MNIEQSSEHFKKMYNKLSYFDQYGNSVFLFILLTIAVFLVHAYFTVLINIQPIKDDWINQRCKPNVIPFAGMINKPPGKTASEFTQENFNYCLQNMLVPVTSNSVNPVNYLVGSFQYMGDGIAGMVNDIRAMFNSIRTDFLDVGEDIMGRLINFLIPIQQIIVKMRDTFAKISAIAISAVYTSLGTYFTLKSLLGSIVQISIQLLIALVSLIVLSFAFLPWLLPITLSLLSIFVSASIPLAIIVVFLTEVMGIPVSTGIPSAPSMPSLSSCFDRATPVALKSGYQASKPIEEIQIGDVLLDGSVVVAVMKLNGVGIRMYDLFGIIVSGSHYVKYDNSWIHVDEHPSAKRIPGYSEPYIYCFSTTTKKIFIGDQVFMDWDDICQVLEEDSRIVSSVEEIHGYFDSGLGEDVPILLKDKSCVKICDVKVGDVLEHDEKVYGVVEIDGTTIQNQKYYRVRGKGVEVEGLGDREILGANIYSREKNLEEVERSVVREDRLFHLLTTKNSFHVGGIQICDYNSAIEKFLEKKYYL
jgi:hypothetical protein